MKIMDLLKKNVRPRDIATLAAFKNAIAVDMALVVPPIPFYIFPLLPMKRESGSI